MSSENKWLLGAQVGASWKVNGDHQLRGALAYYDFRNISGECRSRAPCTRAPTAAARTGRVRRSCRKATA
jgi:hypothetical protein